MGKQRSLLAFILILAIVAAVILIQVPLKLGLDLRGGSQLTLQVKTTEAVPKITPEKLEAVKQVVENRINPSGVQEIVVQIVGEDQLLVQLPGVSDPTEAEKVLQDVAKLDFRAQKPGSEAQFAIELQIRQQKELELAELEKAGDKAAIAAKQAEIKSSQAAIAALFEKTSLTGDKLKTAFAQPLQGNSWEVGLVFNEQGGKEFADLTKNVAGTGRSLGIFLDDRLLSAPRVDAKYAETGIAGGNASVSGNFDAKEAGRLAQQLKGGALPVPVEVVENRTVGASLGQDSIQRSIYAGLFGLALVLIFMVLYYRSRD